MKIPVLLSLLLLFQFCSGFGQKKLIDNDSYKSWISLERYEISNDGNYCWYIQSSVIGGNTLVLTSINGEYRKEFSRVTQPFFTSDSKFLIYYTSGGLCIMRLGADTPRFIQGASGLVSPKINNSKWLLYRLKGNIVLRDLRNETEKTFYSTNEADFNPQGTVLLRKGIKGLIWLDLDTGKEFLVFHGSNSTLGTFSSTGEKITFFVEQEKDVQLWYFRKGMGAAEMLMSSHSPGLKGKGSIATNTPIFSKDGKRIFFDIKQYVEKPHDTDVVTSKIDVWSYKDTWLQSYQIGALSTSDFEFYKAVVVLNTRYILQLENKDTIVVGDPSNEHALVRNRTYDSEGYWNSSQIPEYSLVSLENGRRRDIVIRPCKAMYVGLSPNGNYVGWYDTLRKEYNCYDIKTGIVRNLLKGIDAPFFCTSGTNNRSETYPVNIPEWQFNDEYFILNDEYDIWQLYPRGEKKGVCLTSGFGKRNNIRFRLAASAASITEMINSDTLLLTGLNTLKKTNGFFKIIKGRENSPLPCGEMLEGAYFFPGVTDGFSFPLKAKEKHVYLIRHMNASSPPNLFSTIDFKNFMPISNINSQKEYNWMTSSLISWNISAEQVRQGILYKPENFDSTRKYPIIFNYYEQFSDELHLFRKPVLSEGDLNVAWYVSNGYLVFVPDICYRPGYTGQDALQTITSAVEYLRQYKWIDIKRMGLQGHSLGGYETNYIITHTDLFAAAQSSAGISDMTRCFGDLGFGDQSLARMTEIGSLNMGTSPWVRPDVYLDNSPIYRVDKVKTPLLLLHNKNDISVSFGQSVAFFTALRQLNKKVWLLQYDGEGHTIVDEACKKDFNIRQQQFFSHFLNGTPAPKWLKTGLDANLKGIQSGLKMADNSSLDDIE